jgi:F0F1-type ATP synthase membrane subunit a
MTAGHTILFVLFGMVASTAFGVGWLALIPAILVFFTPLGATTKVAVCVAGVGLTAVLSAVWGFGWIPFAGTVFVYLLESMIALIQATVFTILASVYLGDALKLH